MAIKPKDLESKLQARIDGYVAKIEEHIDRAIERAYARAEPCEGIACFQTNVYTEKVGYVPEEMGEPVKDKIIKNYRAAGWEYAHCDYNLYGGINSFDIELVKSSESLAKAIKRRIDDEREYRKNRSTDDYDSFNDDIFNLNVPVEHATSEDTLFIPRGMSCAVRAKIKQLYAASGYKIEIYGHCSIDYVRLKRKR